MKPPMRQKAWISFPALDAQGKVIYDRNGRPKTTRQETIARVRRKGNLIIKGDGTETNTNIEIDVPRSQRIESGNAIEYVDMDGVIGTGTVISYEEATNIAGSRVLYRTVFVDGR